MVKFYGISPQPATRQAAEKFENDIMIRRDNRFLVSTVYLDMQDERWAVAIAYNPSRSSGLEGPENLLEVRYSYKKPDGNKVTMFRSSPVEEASVAAGPFLDPDAFAQYMLMFERDLITREG
jgi:hypothetical protein